MSKNNLELGQFIHWDWGQNYPFGACMAKLMECLGGDTSLYTYDFFAGLAGDDFVMCYGDNKKYNDCVSVCAGNEAFLARVCSMIGLQYRLVKHAEWTADAKLYYGFVKQFIDRGIPVLCAGVGENFNYDLLISYDDENTKCHLSCGDDVQYGRDIPFREIECDFVFIERLPGITDLAAVYRKAVMQIPALMTAESTPDGAYFGAEAYRKWASDIRSGRYDRYTAETFQGWEHWCIFICNLATNGGHGEGFLRRAYELNPDLTFIPELIRILHENDKVWSELESLGGGFNCTVEVLHDKEKRAAIADVILKLAETNEKIVALANKEIIMQPNIIVKKFMLVGIETHIDFSSDFSETLNQLDSRLHLYLEQIKHTKQPLRKIGFWQPGGIYFAGVEVTQVKDVPTECSVKDLPESLFAVFNENRRGTIGGPKGYAYNQWLPSSAYLVNEDLPGDFEIFDNMECCSEEDPCCIWIPIKKCM